MFVDNKSTVVTDEQAMQDVMALLDDWQAPEPSPWFDARMMALLREEQQRAPQGFFTRLRDRWIYGNSAAMRPVMAGVLAAAVVAAGGGGYWGMVQHPVAQQQPATVSATVQDLQILDNNAQAIQQMDQLLDDSDGDNSSPQS